MSRTPLRPLPNLRRRTANAAPLRPDGDYVLYWMIAARRTTHNAALQHAVWRARELGRPLLVFEPLRIGYPWASERLHRFAMDGMADNRRACERAGVGYYAWLEPEEGAGSGLLEALAGCACAVVTDEYPCFFLPRMVSAAAERLPVCLEVVDGNGLLPLAEPERDFTRAYSFRRYLQKRLRPHLEAFPMAAPLEAAVGPAAEPPPAILTRWPAAAPDLLEGDSSSFLAHLPIDHQLGPVAERGGSAAGTLRLTRFLDERLVSYADRRNHPDEDAASGLSPYLHFGHVSSHQVMAALFEREGWTPDRLSGEVTGQKTGWWGLTEGAEAFVDELVTWRELGFVFNARHPDDYDRYGSLPTWARETLGEHAADPRPEVYDLDTFAAARTHDPLWNAAQRQLVREGRVHNYLRMLWGKKILEWTASPEEALAVMIELNNRYALDGRDPNSYSGIFWVLGRFDRAWGPERPIYGKVRYMTSESTRRKLRVREYLERYGPREA